MTQLVTSDQFITGVLCELVLHGRNEIKLVETMADERFERAYTHLIDRLDQLDIEPDFSLVTNPYHGDSETLRETLYAIRERGVVAINNPSFKTVAIKLDRDDAAEYLKRSPLPREFFSELVDLYFEDGEADLESRKFVERTA
jgi:hypothetical protein